MSAPAPLPTLETERLVLRAPRAEDFPAYAAFTASERSVHVGGPYAEWEAWRRFAQLWGHVALRGFGRFVVAWKDAPDRALGLVGPYFPSEWPEPEIAWSLFEAEGRGVASEAAARARRHAYEDLGWTTAISCCADDNPRSTAVARRLGCTRDGAFDHPEYGRMPIWRHPAPEAA